MFIVTLLDTHIWIWWTHDDPLLPPDFKQTLEHHKAAGLGVSVFSCWEVAKLVELGKLHLPDPVDVWIANALAPSWIQLVPLTPEIAIESTRLPKPFHRDPADQIIVATARVLNCPLITCDHQIRAYPHVRLLP
jgi:PIN domain nuclease of toxin-antitoxin system